MGYYHSLFCCFASVSIYLCVCAVPTFFVGCFNRKVGTDNHSVRLRMIFLFLQYMITFLLVVLSIYFSKQLNFMLHTDPGFRVESVIQANLIYESRDFAVYTMETIKQRQERITEIDQLMKSCPDIQY